MTTEETLKDYLSTRGMIPGELPRDEWYRDNWVRVAIWGRRVPGFPVRSWIAFIPLHAATIGQAFAVATWAALPVLL